MTRFGLLGWAIAVILGLILFFTRSCNTPKVVAQKEEKTVHDTVKITRVDTFFKPYKVEVPVPGLPQIVVKHDTSYVPAKPLTASDSSHALKDYYLKKYYRDSFTLEEAYVGINFEVSQNKVVGSHYQVSNKRKTVENIMNPTPKIRIYVGAQAGWSTGLNTPLFSPMIAVQNQRDNILFGAYDIFHQSYQIGAMVKIHL